MRRFLLFIVILFCSALCWAEMTIYFKDGGARKVHKIEFQQDTADLYLIDGSVQTVPVNSIDLQSSGIAVPVGTYGSKDLGRGSRKSASSSTLSSSEQNRLEDQWKSSSNEYVARLAYQSVAAGDIVRVVSSTGYTVTVIHKESGGDYRKFLIDRSNFADHFEKPKKKEVPARPPVSPRVSTPAIPSPKEQTQPEALPVIPEATSMSPIVEEEASIPTQVSEKVQTNWMYMIIGLALLIGVAGGAFVLSHKGSRVAIDPSKIHVRESELRQRLLRIWLGEGRRYREILELCLNHFFSDQPKVLGASLRILDGDPKSLIVASLMRTNSMTSGQAEVIHEQIQNVIEMSQSLIEDISKSTGLWPSDQQVPSVSGDPRVAQAALFPRAFSTASSERIVIVQRPYIITVSSVLLFLSAALTLMFLFGSFPGSLTLKATIGTPGLLLGAVFTLVCAYGYWTMRRWAVLLYALEVAARFWFDFPIGLIAVPFFIVVFGMIYFSDMTWK